MVLFGQGGRDKRVRKCVSTCSDLHSKTPSIMEGPRGCKHSSEMLNISQSKSQSQMTSGTQMPDRMHLN